MVIRQLAIATEFEAALTNCLALLGINRHDVLRHQMAAAGAPLHAIQEWMGVADYKTTSIYHYAPDPTKGAAWASAAFGEG